MPKFRKKPIEVEAVQFTGDNWAEMHAFTGHFETSDGAMLDVFGANRAPTLWVAANKTFLNIEVGEWVIKDALGFYPCKETVFAETYEAVE